MAPSSVHTIKKQNVSNWNGHCGSGGSGGSGYHQIIYGGGGGGSCAGGNGVGMSIDVSYGARAETKEEKVVRLLKGDFERYCGITFEDFVEVRNKIIEENPEKLI